MNNRETMKMALDCLLAFEKEDYFRWSKEDNACVVALRAALAQPEPDARKLAKIHQAAWNAVHKDYKDDPECCFALGFDAGYGAVAQKVEPSEMKSGERFESFPASPNKEWVGLTDNEYEVMAEQYITNCYFDTLKYAKAIEAKLKEKNT